uniref:alanine racemase n=1 Tax=Aggregatilinea sp. TaxID=2806333 RepID=UPI002BFC5CF8
MSASPVFPTFAEIDLDAIAHNVRAIKTRLAPSTEFVAVVKANAYGHGAVPVGRAALDAGASRLAVARVAEGVELRR